MKRTALQRRTPLRSRPSAFFKRKDDDEIVYLTSGPLKRTSSLKRTVLKALSDSPVAELKRTIQAQLRELAIRRDGGCVLRHYPEALAGTKYEQCGPYKSKGIVLQAEHLVTRGNSISYGDMRNIVCLCQRHHKYFKEQHGRLYWELIEKHIGPDRWAYIKRVEADKRPYKFGVYEWTKVSLALKAELVYR